MEKEISLNEQQEDMVREFCMGILEDELSSRFSRTVAMQVVDKLDSAV